ncbi:hypothetical protein BG015_004475 [Linnemannia schmuckeri]|uniref:Phosphotyrosine protein phosphatase I domain-containing protein n=1 Tax=Linnemannia schmuckeri TaxID=64567 RepID=A0A9P5RCQ2_9FUNG|nr:hypothetical protein BG015_004475 [Linnemannia schmuckeri]
MAAAFFNKHRTQDEIKGISAGTNPASEVHDVVRETTLEKDIDIKPVKLTPELTQTCSIIAIMGCGESCPYVPGVKIIDWQIADPKNSSLDEVRKIRNEIETKIKIFITENSY